jgi:hypothetical protein
MFSALRLARLAVDVCSDTIAARLSVSHIAFDATRIAGNTSELCPFSRWFGRHGGSVGKEPTSATHFKACQIS